MRGASWYRHVLAGAILAHYRDSFSQRIDCLFKLLDLRVFLVDNALVHHGEFLEILVVVVPVFAWNDAGLRLY